MRVWRLPHNQRFITNAWAPELRNVAADFKIWWSSLAVIVLELFGIY